MNDPGCSSFETLNSPLIAVRTPSGNWHCERAATLYDGISCAEGHYKVREEEFEKLCEDAGTPCPDGYTCYCKPCIKAFEVSVFPLTSESEFNRDNGCDKMSLCGKAEQTKDILFHAFDNRKRENVTVTALVHLGQEERHLLVNEVEPFLYQFGFSHNERGVAIVEVYFDGIQIPESPVRVEVTARDCEADYPGKGKIPVSAKSEISFMFFVRDRQISFFLQLSFLHSRMLSACANALPKLSK